MPSPTSRPVSLRPDLATMVELDLEMQRRNYIGLQLFPEFGTSQAIGNFNVVALESLLASSDEVLERAASSGWNRADWKFEPRTYATQQRGAEEPLDDNEKAIYADILDAEMLCVARAYERVLAALERRVIAKAVTDTVTNGYTTTAGTTWSTHSTATPVKNVFDAGEKIRARTGLYPNAVAMSRKVWRNLIQCEQLHDRLNSAGAGRDSTSPTKEMVAELFDVQHVIVADSVKLASGTVSSILPDTNVLVCRVATTNDPKEPCIGRVINFTGEGTEATGSVEEYYQPEISSQVYRVKHQTDELVLYKELAEVITGVLS